MGDDRRSRLPPRPLPRSRATAQARAGPPRPPLGRLLRTRLPRVRPARQGARDGPRYEAVDRGLEHAREQRARSHQLRPIQRVSAPDGQFEPARASPYAGGLRGCVPGPQHPGLDADDRSGGRAPRQQPAGRRALRLHDGLRQPPPAPDRSQPVRDPGGDGPAARQVERGPAQARRHPDDPGSKARGPHRLARVQGLHAGVHQLAQGQSGRGPHCQGDRGARGRHDGRGGDRQQPRRAHLWQRDDGHAHGQRDAQLVAQPRPARAAARKRSADEAGDRRDSSL